MRLQCGYSAYRLGKREADRQRKTDRQTDRREMNKKGKGKESWMDCLEGGRKRRMKGEGEKKVEQNKEGERQRK